MSFRSESFAMGIAKEAMDDGQLELLYFYKEGCPACKSMDKVIEKFEDENKEGFVKIDIMESPAMCEYFSVDRVPAIVIENNNQQQKLVGYANLGPLQSKYEKVKENG